MATSRSLTYHRRDLVDYLVDDDPDRAEKLFELMASTDPATAAGAAGHADVTKYAYSLTRHSEQSQKSHVQELLNSVAALVACMMSIVT